MVVVTEPDADDARRAGVGAVPRRARAPDRTARELAADTTLLLIEHDMDVALRVAERVVVMADGVVIAAGTPAEIRSDPLVNEMYLGTAGSHG